MAVMTTPTDFQDMFAVVRVQLGTHTIEYDFALTNLLVIDPNDPDDPQLAPQVLDIMQSEALAHFQYAMQGTTDWTHFETLFACFGFSAKSPSHPVPLKDGAHSHKQLLIEIQRLSAANATDLIIDCTCLGTLIVPVTWDAKNFDYIGTTRHLPVFQPSGHGPVLAHTSAPLIQQAHSASSDLGSVSQSTVTLGSNDSPNPTSSAHMLNSSAAPLQAPPAVVDPTFDDTAISPSTWLSDLLTVHDNDLSAADLEPDHALGEDKPDPAMSPVVLSSDLEPDPTMSPVVLSSALEPDPVLSSNPDPYPALGEDKPDPAMSQVVLSSDLEPDPVLSSNPDPYPALGEDKPDPTVSPVVLSSDLEPDPAMSLAVSCSDLEPDPILSPTSGEDSMSLPVTLVSLGLLANAFSADLEPDPALGEDKPDPAVHPVVSSSDLEPDLAVWSAALSADLGVPVTVLSSDLEPDPAMSSAALSSVLSSDLEPDPIVSPATSFADLEPDPTMATLSKAATVAVLSSDLEPDPAISPFVLSSDLELDPALGEDKPDHAMSPVVSSSNLKTDPAVSSTALSAALEPDPTMVTLSKAVTVAVLSSDLEPDPAVSSTALSADLGVPLTVLPSDLDASLVNLGQSTNILFSNLEPDPTASPRGEDITSISLACWLASCFHSLAYPMLTRPNQLSSSASASLPIPAVTSASGEDNMSLLASLVSLGRPANAQPVNLAPTIQFPQSGEDTNVATAFHLTQSGEEATVATPFSLFSSNIIAAPDGSTRPMNVGSLTSKLEPTPPSSIAPTGSFTANLEPALAVALAALLLANLAASKVPVFGTTARDLPTFALGAPAGHLRMTAHSIAVALGHCLFAFHAVLSCDLAPDPQSSELLAFTHNVSTSVALNCYWKHPAQQSTCLLHSVLLS